ncbi:response regulator transcription factor [Pseudoalteromonas tunicata]|uniref:response regulator transcription factor n=1 Tax=Pseudoalteromonas tunicata TaxID=314281 RepID=UPI00273D970B|nr:response regulator transcription factor [Pseudoalteromonas tunicata]MDP4984268.1 response regulator transcription factor [Pseudoalteromonas tunicata]MDP5214954.1 response regulator transcription factor [Pseudoalteromonas tunicata]
MKEILIIDDDEVHISKIRDALKLAYRDVKITNKKGTKNIFNTILPTDFNMIIVSYKNDIKLANLIINEAINLDKNLKVIIYSYFDDQNSILNLLHLPAAAIVLKQDSYNCLVRAFKGLDIETPQLSNKVIKTLIQLHHQAFAMHFEPIKSLTKRENDVLIELVKGSSNKEIARDLNISSFTVADHIKSMFSKLNVSSRGAVIAYGLNQRQMH